MKVILSNNMELECLGVHSSTIQYQGSRRDVYTFLFDPNVVPLTTIDEQFTDLNCERIILITDENEQFLHEFYSIRAGLGQGFKESAIQGIAYSGDVSEPVQEVVNWVKMIRTTYEERALVEAKEILETLMLDALTR